MESPKPELPVCDICGWIHLPQDEEACLGPPHADELVAFEDDDYGWDE